MHGQDATSALTPKRVRRVVLLAGVLGGLEISDPVVSAFALPKAGRALGMAASTLALAASVSIICLAATVMLMGAIADRIGRRRLMVTATVVVIVADLVVAIAPAIWVFMIGRAIAGIALGGILATGYAYVRTISDPRKLPANLGTFAAVQAALPIPLCVVAAGLATVNWRLAFVCVPVVTAICLPMELRLFPRLAPAPRERQLYGLTILALGIASGLFGISQIPGAGSLPLKSTVPFAVGVALVAVSVAIGLKTSKPAFPVRIFRSPVFITAAASGALWNMSLALTQLQSSNLMQYAHSVTPFAVSVIQLPLTLALIAGAYLIGRLITGGKHPRVIISSGLMMIAAGFALLSLTGGSPLGIGFILALAVVGFGIGTVNTAQSHILMTEAPQVFEGSVAASRTTFGQVGQAIGLAGSTVLTSLMTVRIVNSPDALHRLNDFLTAHETSDASPGVSTDFLRQFAVYYGEGFQASMWVWAGLMVLGAVACYALLRMRPNPLT